MSARFRHSLFLVAALAASACTNKPNGFGVDVEARTSMLPSATKSAIVSARLLVTGAESFQRDIAGVAKAAQSGAMKFRYVPGVHTGTITIRVDGIDAGGNTVAAGISQPVNLVDGKAVDAVLFLATNGNGVPCMAMTDCISNNCVDGVCCESTCDGACETCNLPGQPGVCSPQPMGMDPDNDCAAKIPPPSNVDGGTDADGGTAGGVTVNVDPSKCAGACNGMRACAFPDTSKSCGANYCPAAGTVGAFFCDGNGACNEKDTTCTDYICSGGACKTSCSSDADCLATDFCNLNINQCVPKRVLGQTCSGADQCGSGFCASGVCCDSACNDPSGIQSCNNSGNVGHCQCTGVTCDAGVSCVLWYKDADGDTFGDATGTIATNTAKAGCASGTNSTPPSPFVTNNKDCDDGDASANPNVPATSWFTTPSKGKGIFDYNCDGAVEKETAEIAGGACNFCYFQSLPFSCNAPATCSTAGNQAYFSCGFRIKPLGCAAGPTVAFTGNPIPCGSTAVANYCGTCSAAGGASNNFTGSVQQRCH